MRSLRHRLTAAALCVVGSALALLAASQVWVEAVVAEEGLPRVTVTGDGRALAPVVPALALVGLAGAVVLLAAARQLLRRAAAAVVAAAGVGVVLGAGAAALDLRDAVRPEVADTVGLADVPLAAVDGSPWSWVAVAAGVVLVAGALLAVAPPARAGGPGRVGAAPRFDADVPGRRTRGTAEAVDLDDEDAVWKALDRGDDPTDPQG